MVSVTCGGLYCAAGTGICESCIRGWAPDASTFPLSAWMVSFSAFFLPLISSTHVHAKPISPHSRKNTPQNISMIGTHIDHPWHKEFIGTQVHKIGFFQKLFMRGKVLGCCTVFPAWLHMISYTYWLWYFDFQVQLGVLPIVMSFPTCHILNCFVFPEDDTVYGELSRGEFSEAEVFWQVLISVSRFRDFAWSVSVRFSHLSGK